MFCSFCGKEVNDGELTCPYCKKPIFSNIDKLPHLQYVQDAFKKIIRVFVILQILIVIGFTVYVLHTMFNFDFSVLLK